MYDLDLKEIPDENTQVLVKLIDKNFPTRDNLLFLLLFQKNYLHHIFQLHKKFMIQIFVSGFWWKYYNF